MDAAAVVALTIGLGAPVITYLANPYVQARLKKQQENDPALGWKTAVEELKTVVTKQGVEIRSLRTEVEELEEQLRSKIDLIARQDRIIDDQGMMIRAFSSRVLQLEEVFRVSGRALPPLDPAVAYWLSRPIPTNPSV